jgi:hypothetical protein
MKEYQGLLKGIGYRNIGFYHALNWLKLGIKFHLRFQLAGKFISPGQVVLDVCAGDGTFKDFLPPGCVYKAVDQSQDFLSILEQKQITAFSINLHNGMGKEDIRADILVMIISLSQFWGTSCDLLLEEFKIAAPKVVILEEALRKARNRHSLRQKAGNYLFYTKDKDSYDLFTRKDLKKVLDQHGYQYQQLTTRYSVGLYGFE